MKKSILHLMVFSLLSISCVSIAQPTLTSTGTNYTVGTSFSTFSASYVSPGNSGANQTWDLSSMSGTTSNTMGFVPPTSTAYSSYFPQANLACTATAYAAVGYYKVSSTAMQVCGSYNSFEMVYSNLEDLMRYPCTYNSTYTDPWVTQYTANGYTFYRKGTTTVTADGYGTLITPNATYTNTMRVHVVQTYQDSAYLGYQYIATFTNDEYMWYKEGINMQIATVYSLTGSGNTYTGGSYLTGNIGVENIEKNQIVSVIYPNPTSNNLTIEYSLQKNENIELQLINSLGQQTDINYTTIAFQGDNSIKLDISKLPEGIYFAQLKIKGEVIATKRFIKSSIK